MINIPHKVSYQPTFSMLPKNAGQGLIEALMIAVFIGFNVIGFISFQNYLSYTTELTQQTFDANLLARSRIESLRYFSVINTTSGYTAYQNIATATSTATVGNTTYTITSTITNVASPVYKNVNVNITWTDKRGNAQSVRLVTNIASLDPSAAASFM